MIARDPTGSVAPQSLVRSNDASITLHLERGICIQGDKIICQEGLKEFFFEMTVHEPLKYQNRPGHILQRTVPIDLKT